MKYVTSLLLIFSFFVLSACTHAYSSHHGNRAGRYNNVPYNNAYYYNDYRIRNTHMGRPYRSF